MSSLKKKWAIYVVNGNKVESNIKNQNQSLSKNKNDIGI